MVFVTQIMWWELNLQTVNNCIGFLGWTKFEALGPSLLRSYFAMGHIAWCVTSALPIFVSHRSSAFLWVIRLIAFETQVTAILHAVSLVSCHTFLRLCLCFDNSFKPGRSLLISERVILFVDSLYAEAIEAVKSCAALSVFIPELFRILVDISSKARLWNRSQSVKFQ
jgi:hypothetical protein